MLQKFALIGYRGRKYTKSLLLELSRRESERGVFECDYEKLDKVYPKTVCVFEKE